MTGRGSFQSRALASPMRSFARPPCVGPQHLTRSVVKPRLVRRARRSRSTSAETYTTPQPEKAVSEAISSVQRLWFRGGIGQEGTGDLQGMHSRRTLELLTHGHKERPR